MLISKKASLKVFMFLFIIMIIINFPVQIQKEAASSNTLVSNKVNNQEKIVIYDFWGEGCHVCNEEKIFLEKMKTKYSWLDVQYYEIYNVENNYKYLINLLNKRGEKFTGAPVIIIGKKTFSGFSKQNEGEIEAAIKYLKEHKIEDVIRKERNQLIEGNGDSNSYGSNPVKKEETIDNKENKTNENILNIPYFGEINAKTVSIPLMTIILGTLDSFNPCSFFVLFSLLGLLMHAHSRKKIMIVGLIFVFCSGIIYLLFMAAWLNVYMLMSNIKYMTMIAGIISIIIALLNIKDFFILKKGISLTIADNAKTKLFKKMRKLAVSESAVYVVVGTIFLALAANCYELLCTVGFPMIYTKILTLNNLNTSAYYFYLILYNIIYVIPLLIIVGIFSKCFGKMQISVWQGRVLKLISGMMMLELGILLILNPYILVNINSSVMILLCTIGVSLLVAYIGKILGFDKEEKM